MKLASLLTVIVLSLVGCKKDAPATTPPDNTGGDPVAAEPTACTADADCVAVELECCDACNGGNAIGVHKDHVDAVVADSPRGRGECGGVACTEMACPAWVAACTGGTCSITRGAFE